MATELSGVVHCGMRVSYKSGLVDLEFPYSSFDDAAPSVYSGGSGTLQADIFWSDRRTLSASASETLDLRGALTNGLGETCAFGVIKAIYIKAATGNTNTVDVGNGANPFLGFLLSAAHRLKLSPGQKICIEAPAAGWAVTNGSNDDLLIANGGAGTSVSYDIAILGVLAV